MNAEYQDESYFILGSISDLLFEKMQFERTVALVNVDHDMKDTINTCEVIRYSVVTPEYLVRT